MAPFLDTLHAAQATDPGSRERSNDSTAVLMPPSETQQALGALFVIADGIGEMGGGGAASTAATAEMARSFYAAGTPDVMARLKTALDNSSNAVRAAAATHEQPYLGAMAAGLVVTPAQEGLAFTLGDCRVYRHRNGLIELLARDQRATDAPRQGSEVDDDEAPTSELVATSFLGQAGTLAPSYHRAGVSDGDRFILCSDSLWRHVDANDMARIVQTATPEAAAEKLVALARERGAQDDVTALVVYVGQAKGRRGALPLVPLVAALLALAVLGVGAALLAGTRGTAADPTATILSLQATQTAVPASPLPLVAADTPEISTPNEVIVVVESEAVTEEATAAPRATVAAATADTPTPPPTEPPTDTPTSPPTEAPATPLTQDLPVGAFTEDFENSIRAPWLNPLGLEPVAEDNNTYLRLAPGESIGLAVNGDFRLSMQTRFEDATTLEILFLLGSAEQYRLRFEGGDPTWQLYRLGVPALDAPFTARRQQTEDGWRSVQVLRRGDLLQITIDSLAVRHEDTSMLPVDTITLRVPEDAAAPAAIDDVAIQPIQN